jgi:hypothetical protein
MIGSKSIVYYLMSVLVFSNPGIIAFAAESVKIDVSYTLDAEKEKIIRDLGALPVHQAFKRLKRSDILSNEKFLNKAVFYAFQNRRSTAVAFALNAMQQQLYSYTADGRPINRGVNVYIAGKVFAMFPGESISPLVRQYQRGDAITRANIIRASGAIADHPRIGQLLITALNDKAFYEREEGFESVDMPMRVCDHAYNQIVLHYQIKSVLRTISPVQRVETRNYHIDILKNILKERDLK